MSVAPGGPVPFATDAERRRARDLVERHLRAGGLLAYPTETVYGLGCLPRDDALEALSALKRRPPEKPFLVLVRDRADTASLAWNPAAEALAEAFWPGPLTLILDDPQASWPPGVRDPQGGVAVRLSPHPAVAAILAAAGGPVTSTSANLPGEPPATSAAALGWLADRPGPTPLVLDGGPLPQGPPSTVVDCRGRPRITRSGAVGEEEVRGALASVAPLFDERARRGPEETARGTTFNLLFVCTGNTCRSPTAEGIARKVLADRGWSHVAVSSAGVAAAVGAPASEAAQRVAAAHGVDLADHRARQLSRERVEWADLILAMGGGHLDAVFHLGGGERAELVTAFASGAGAGRHVPDPMGADDEAYEETFRTLRDAIEAALDRLAPILSP